MTQDDIIKLAREAGFVLSRDEHVFTEKLERFFALAVQAEREDCAIAAAIHCQYPITTDYDRGFNDGRMGAARAIRARNHVADASKTISEPTDWSAS